MRKSFGFLPVMLITLILTGCWSAQDGQTDAVNQTDPAGDASSANRDPDQNDRPPDSQTSKTEPDADNRELTPTQTLEAYNAAAAANNPEKVKRLVSKGSLELITERAREEGLSFDQMIRQGKGIPAIEAAEMQNEKISGNTATVEVRFEEREGFDTVPFVKEDGLWKIDFVKFLNDIVRKTNS